MLGRQTGTIRRFIRDGDRVIGALARRRRDVSRFVREASRTAEIGASRREQLALTFNRLPAFLEELEPYMGRLDELATAQIPLLRDLQAASRDLDTFLIRLRPFAQTGTPALTALGDASRVGTRAVRATNAELDELRRLGPHAPALAKPLRQLLHTIDDRRRAVEPDLRPPPPTRRRRQDPHLRPGGFTGMEAIWNVIFDLHPLSTNAFDSVGHILRLSVLVGACGQPHGHPRGWRGRVFR